MGGKAKRVASACLVAVCFALVGWYEGRAQTVNFSFVGEGFG